MTQDNNLPLRQLGRTDMRITRVGFGSWAVGGDWAVGWGDQDDGDSVAAIRHAVARGVNWIDTAAIYGLGHSEEVVAAALEGIPKSRRPYVFTKGGLVPDATDRRKGPKQLCPVPGCKNPAAPVFGMVCAKHKDIPKAQIKKYREARRAKKSKKAA